MRIGIACAAAGVIVCAGTAMGQIGYSISTSGSPDTISKFDLTNPGAVTPIGPVAGDFNRGMEMTTLTEGWIMQTSDAISGVQRGLYKFNATSGAVGFVADPFGANLSSGGDLTLGPGGAFMYATTGDDLWRLNFDGTGTNLGTITIDGVDAGTILGLTYDAATDSLYGLRSVDDLIKIDPNTVTAGIIGLTGQQVGGVGAMDQTPDGRLVASIDSSGSLWEINPTTGLATTFYGQLGENVTAMAFEIPAPGVSAMVLGLGLMGARRRR